MDKILEILFSNKEQKLVPSKAGLGAKRKAEFEKYGYGVSNAVHAIRLLGQLYELLTTEHITFPRPEADVLRNIRAGKYKFKEAEEIYDELHFKINEVKEKSLLPKKTNKKNIRKI